jgi:hypothetical protein
MTSRIYLYGKDITNYIGDEPRWKVYLYFAGLVAAIIGSILKI